MAKFSLTWDLMKSSWELLKKDRELLIFPLISGICCLLVMFSFIYPFITGPEMQLIKEGKQDLNQFKYYVIMFLFYFFTYLIIIFFNSAIIACVMIRLEGGDPTIKDGFNTSMSMLPLITVWALIAASVGMLLRMIEDRSDGIGQIVSGLLGLAWSAISFLVIPILVVERRGPIASLKESTRLLKRTWGEQLIGRFSFGIVFAILGIPAYLLVFMGISSMTRSSSGGIILIVLAVIYLLILALVQSALQAIFQAVMYKYVRDRKAPTGFNPYMLEGAFSRKKKNFSMGRF